MLLNFKKAPIFILILALLFATGTLLAQNPKNDVPENGVSQSNDSQSNDSQNAPQSAPASAAQLTADQIIYNATPSVALVIASHQFAGTTVMGAAVVIREDGVLLTPRRLVLGAGAVQVRFRNGQIFNTVELLGVDAKRDIAAIKITASGLPAVPPAGTPAKPGEPVAVVSHAAGLPWSASTGIVAAYRPADEVPDAGTGYRLLQFTAPASAGSGGGVVMNSQGRALGVIVGSISRGQNLNFAVPLEDVIALANAPATLTFANGSALILRSAAQMTPAPIAGPMVLPAPPPPPHAAQVITGARPDAPDQSDLLKDSKDRDFILHNFRTMYVDAHEAKFFGSDQMKAALGSNSGFGPLNIRIVDDPKVADVVLSVSYTFAWDFPFQLKHQNTTMVLLAGKGEGPFSGPLGAASVAFEFVNMAKRYRVVKEKKESKE